MDLNEEQLHSLQDRLKYLLSQFDSFCCEHGVSYTLEGGTALGAFRYGDIIPWDDDIDIRMDIKEYKKFCKAFNQYGSSSFYLQQHKTDPLYFNEFAKVRDTHSFFQEDILVTYKCNGVFIDVFVFEHAFPILVFIAHCLYRPLFSLSHIRLERHKLLVYIANVYYSFIQIFIFAFRIVSYLFKAKNYSYTYGSNLNAFKYRYRSAMFEGKRELRFGDKDYPVPALIEDYLTVHYGESYMTPPPLNLQVPHHIKEFVLYPLKND